MTLDLLERRAEELKIFEERKVYEVVPRSSMVRGAKLIGVRWVDTNKGTLEEPNIRSRLVCQELGYGSKTPDDMFAPTPPLLATRWLLSSVASQGGDGPGNERIMLLDFKRAFLYGACERDLYIELPEDDRRKAGGRNVGKLLKAMYGLRDAPVVWHKMVNGMLLSRGFASSTTVACMYSNVKT